MSKRIAYIFPGQASQFVGMAKDLFDEYEVARTIFGQASEVLGFDLQKVCFEGQEAELTKTYITQPAILTHSAILTTILKSHGLKPAMAAGHSLGEYSALYAAEVLDFEEVLRLVKLRGDLMHRAGIEQPGTMAAVVGLDPDAINAVCEDVTRAGREERLVVQAANYNSQKQTVISGSIAAVEQAMAAAKEKGAKIVKKLSVGGAFHSPLMASAGEGLRAGLQQAAFREAACPIYPNVTASAATHGEQLKKSLDQQLTGSVRWLATMQNMVAGGAEEFWEVGPGKVLSGLLKQIDRECLCRQVGTVDELRSVLN